MLSVMQYYFLAYLLDFVKSKSKILHVCFIFLGIIIKFHISIPHKVEVVICINCTCHQKNLWFTCCLHRCNLNNGWCRWQPVFQQLNMHISRAAEESCEWLADDISCDWSVSGHLHWGCLQLMYIEWATNCWTKWEILPWSPEFSSVWYSLSLQRWSFPAVVFMRASWSCSKLKWLVDVVVRHINCQCDSYTASCTLVFLTQVQIVALLLWSFIALMTLDAGWNTIRFNFCPVDLYRPSYVLRPSNGKRQRSDSLSSAQYMCSQIVDCPHVIRWTKQWRMSFSFV